MVTAALDHRLQPLVDGGVLDDPWSRGSLRLSAEPVVLERAEAAAICGAACTVAMMLDEAVPAIARDHTLAQQLGIDDSLAQIAALDAPKWLALARADVFQVAGMAPQVCEINCDTPTGLAECTGLGAIALHAQGDDSRLRDPSARLGERWVEMVRSCLPRGATDAVVGILDPTEMTEDLGHVRLLTRWLEAAGFQVVRGSPFNLHACPGNRVGLFGIPCAVLIRHYKTDWWSRRSSPWSDVPAPPDSDRLERELDLIADAMAAGTVTVLNPWGAALAQNKRTLALPWERPELFHADTLARIRIHLPETRFLETYSRERLRTEREQWVLKSDYGCEGAEVMLGSLTSPEEWERALSLAVPGHWVVQRAFVPSRNTAGHLTNHGVFLIGGLPSGIYTRCSAEPTDDRALSCPTLVRV
jgi:glutathionylspermidine synthase